MSGRLQSKQSRPWERGSPGRKRFGSERISAVRNDRRDPGSPDRSKRGRWEFRGGRMDSPPRTHLESPAWMRRRDYEFSPRAGQRDGFSPSEPRRSGFDGSRPSFLLDHHRAEEEHRVGMGRHEGQGPAGLVFLCSSTTLRECFHYRVLGLPAAQREVVERVVPGTKLFLFNFDTRALFGVFEAASRGGLDLVPEAFLDCKAGYAAQVRFNILRECSPLSDELVRDVLGQNFSQRGKFECELNGDQVQKIMQLFSRSLGDPVPDREKHALGMHGLERDGGHLFLQGPFLHESQLLLNRPLPDGLTPDVILGKDMIDEVDQLALKYLQNHPGIAGFHLDPINMSLLSTTLRKNLPAPSMDQSLAPGRGMGGVHANGLLPGLPFSAAGAGGMPNPSLLGHHGSSVLENGKMEGSERSGADGGKTSGHILPSSTLSDRGLLPIPPRQPGLPPPGNPNHSGFSLSPNQPGMAHTFPAGGRFPMAAGPMVGIRPELGGHFHPLQGPHGLPSHSTNPISFLNTSAPANGQQTGPQKGANKKFKKNKQKKKSKLQKDDKDAKKDEKDLGH